MRLLRELSPRKLRTALTIAGITIGIWALVVFHGVEAVLARIPAARTRSQVNLAIPWIR